MKEIKEDINKRNILCSFKSLELFSVEWKILEELRCQFSSNGSIILMQSQLIFLVTTETLILTFIWKGKGTRLAKTILKKEEQSWRTETSLFKDLTIKLQ